VKPIDFGVLLILSQGVQHGCGIVKMLGGEAVGGIRLAPSNLYHVLDRMVAAGFVEATRPTEPEDDAVRRRYFGITPLGRAVVAAFTRADERPDAGRRPQDVRNASTGSARAARRAGTYAANQATSRRTATAPPNVTGSRALTP
jgi:DNA-binding PadR family transcriptional regulator